MNKKYYIAIFGLSAATLALSAVYKEIKKASRLSPLEMTIKRVMEGVDRETFRLLTALNNHLKSLPPEEAFQEAQSYIDGKKPIGSLSPGDFTEQPYRDLRIESDGLVYFSL